MHKYCVLRGSYATVRRIIPFGLQIFQTDSFCPVLSRECGTVHDDRTYTIFSIDDERVFYFFK